MRTRSSGRPRAALTSAGIEAWLMKHGMEMRERTLPKDTVILKSLAFSQMAREIDASPVTNDMMLPALEACAEKKRRKKS